MSTPVIDAPALTANGGRDTRLIATGLLVLMAAVYVAARVTEARHPAIGYIRAFAEAAMVGGLADWFAVTALFRHPLGLPIPHTAIIPRNKDRIGDTLAAFLKQNFLIPRLIARIQAEEIREVILALNATVEGQTTAHYIAEAIGPAGPRITSLAQGVPIGGELDYLDDGTISAALRARRSF